MNESRRWLSLILLALVALVSTSNVSADPPELWQRSYVLEARGDHVGALAALNQLPAEEQRGYLFLARRAWLLYRAGRHQESVGAYRLAIAEAPEAVEPRAGILLPLIALRRFRDAEAEARAGLRIDHDNHAISRSLAWALYNLGRFDQAERAYRRIVALHPSDLEMRAGIGWCLLRRGRRADAAAEFRAVLAVSPENAAALAGLHAAMGLARRESAGPSSASETSQD